MKWDQVLAACAVAVLADPVLAALYGTALRYVGTGSLEVPLLEYQLITDSETELWAPCTIQFDQWCATLEDLTASERALRRLFHREIPAVIGGLGMWAQYLEGNQLTTPDRDNYHGRAIRFRLTPLRARYEAGIPIPS